MRHTIAILLAAVLVGCDSLDPEQAGPPKPTTTAFDLLCENWPGKKECYTFHLETIGDMCKGDVQSPHYCLEKSLAFLIEFTREPL